MAQCAGSKFRLNVQTWKKFFSFRDPSLEFIIISAKYPTKNQQFRHFTQIDDWFLLQNCQNTLYFIILSTKEVLFLLKTSILLQLWKKFPQLYRNFRDPGSRGSRVFPCLVDSCPRRLLSKDNFCPRRLLSKETFFQGDNCINYCPRKYPIFGPKLFSTKFFFGPLCGS